VVFDGNNPTPGLVRAAQSKARRLVWVRRGMMGQVPPKHLDNARFMDLIIEPGEIAAEWDTGPTSWRRDEVLLTDPITLLDRKEVLPRGRARKALGLAQDDLTVLVHLGAGLNRDAAYLIGDVVENLKNRDALKLVIAEWENSPVELPHWPGTLRLRGFPLSRYLNAFDFSISAAGYNSYHECLAFGLPTIFIANRHPAMDDQGARAEFAQHHSAGFDLREDELFQLPALCEAMRSKAARTYIRQQGLKLSRKNGAATAANAILDLIEAP
jgi:glycosyl transferase family 28